VFFRSVREGTTAAYNAAARENWAPDDDDGTWVEARLAGNTCLVADQAGRAIGFMLMRPDGHVDLAYVLPEHMGRGVGDALYAALLAEARALGLSRLDTRASPYAEKFFRRHGWTETGREAYSDGGPVFDLALMECRLAEAT
jgi:putative acetyltransferase